MSATTPLDRRLAALEAEQAEQKTPAKRFRPPSLLSFVESLRIPDKASKAGGTTPFLLYPRQREALKVLAANKRVVIVKARQIGVSLLTAARVLFETQYKPNIQVLVAKQSLDESKDTIRRLRIMWESIPEALHPQPLTIDSSTMLGFANGSTLEALTATEHLARGRSAHYGIADEVNYWEHPEQMVLSMDAACENLVVISTGSGPDTILEKLWDQSQAGTGRYAGIFLNWRSVPARVADRDWYRRTVLEASAMKLARREYPATVDECFAMPQGSFFDRWSEANVRDFDVAADAPTWRGIDLGYRRSAVVYLQRHNGRLCIFDELCPTDTTTPELALAIKAHEAHWKLSDVRSSFVDPAGNASNLQTGTPDMEILRNEGLVPRSMPSAIRDGVLRMVNLIAEPELPLLVHPRCKTLVKAFATIGAHRSHPDVYNYDHATLSHVLDASRYAIVNLARNTRPSSPASVGIGKISRRRMEF